MGTHQCRRVVFECFTQHRNRRRVVRVAKGNGDVAHEAVALGAADRTAGKARLEAVRIEAQQIRQVWQQGRAVRRVRRVSPASRSTGRLPGRRRSRRSNCRAAAADRSGSAHGARWSDRRCTGAHPRRSRASAPASGTGRDSACRCRNDREPAGSASRSRLVSSSPRKKYEPSSVCRMLVFLPNQPSPPRAAHSRSRMAPVSTYDSATTSGRSAVSAAANSSSLLRTMR